MTNCVGILGDIGGTNARFALLDPSGQITGTKIYQVREVPTLIQALEKFQVDVVKNSTVQAVALAIAGPVLGDVVQLTNSDWVCNRSQIAELFGISDVHILNDFEAIAVAVGDLGASDYSVMQAGSPSMRHPRLVMGPGTGLGVAALKPTNNGFEAITTEAGHMRYAPANEREYELVRILSRKLSFVSAEDLVSGPGLLNLYQASAQMVGAGEQLESPAEVVEGARSGNPLCRQVLSDFAAVFGSYASQVALSYNALGGVYLTGGVLEKMGQDFDQKRFLGRFATNRKMSNLLAQMPVYRVESEIPAFNGLRATIAMRSPLKTTHP